MVCQQDRDTVDDRITASTASALDHTLFKLKGMVTDRTDNMAQVVRRE
jgi:hypothetical protein